MPSFDVVAFIISLVLGVPSLWLAIAADKKAESARAMAQRLISRSNLQEDGERARRVISALNRAKDAAMSRQTGAPPSASLGRSPEDDLQALRQAHDALSTGLPLELSLTDRQAIAAKAEELAMAIQAVVDNPSQRDGWKDGLTAIQGVIFRLETVERRARNAIVLPQDAQGSS
jgi:hypothetical protein